MDCSGDGAVHVFFVFSILHLSFFCQQPKKIVVIENSIKLSDKTATRLVLPIFQINVWSLQL